MTDRERLVALLEDFGVCYWTKDRRPSYIHVDDNSVAIPSYTDEDSAGIEGRNAGYGSFFANFVFDEADAFVMVGIWE